MRRHFEVHNDPASWGTGRLWSAGDRDRLASWKTENHRPDGTYRLRLRAYTLTGGKLKDAGILPVCGAPQGRENGLVLTIDNRFVGPSTRDSVHTNTFEPRTEIVSITVGNQQVDACGIVQGTKGKDLIIDFIAHDPDGHLDRFELRLNHGDNISTNLLTVAGVAYETSPFSPLPPGVPLVVATDFKSVYAPVTPPKWYGGLMRIRIPADSVFPEPCAYLLELRAFKRTIVNCSTTHDNISQRSFTVIP
jgi:hypothetical protein